MKTRVPSRRLPASVQRDVVAGMHYAPVGVDHHPAKRRISSSSRGNEPIILKFVDKDLLRRGPVDPVDLRIEESNRLING